MEKSDPRSPFSPKSNSLSSEYSGKKDSFIKFINSSRNNFHISSFKSKNIQESKYKFDKSPSVKAAI